MPSRLSSLQERTGVMKPLSSTPLRCQIKYCFEVNTGRACCCVDACLHHRQEVQRLQAAEKDAAALRTREGKLQTALAEVNLENLELRWRLAAAREATNPSLAQVGIVRLLRLSSTYQCLSSSLTCSVV